MTRVLVTGARGFVGRFAVEALASAGVEVVTALRDDAASAVAGTSARLGPDSTPEAMQTALSGVDAVVHLAAHVHDMSQRTSPLQYQRVNCEYPLALARAAAGAGVARFIFVSTIKVNGDGTTPGQTFSEASSVAPLGPYAESKWRAELGLAEVSARTQLATRIVRPPLVYGPGVRANFRSLMLCVKRGIPLPFAAVDNARSLVYVENLAHLLASLALAPGLPGCRTYLVADGEDLSTPALIRRLASALRVSPRLFPIPPGWLRTSLSLVGRGGVAERLLGSLQVDSSLVRQELAWRPPFSVSEGLARTVARFEGA